MSREMTKKEIKNFMKGLVESKWERVHNLNISIRFYDECKEPTELETKCFEIDKETKHEVVKEIIELEKLYETFFGKDINEER